jgi:hypothetical protein
MAEISSPISVGKSIVSTSSSPSKYRRTRLHYPPAERLLESPNHRACVETSLGRIPAGSEALSPLSQELERRWNSRFQVMFSKDNHKAYTHVREYFDSPRKFEEGIPRKNMNQSPRNKPRQEKKRYGSALEQREMMWSTRYTASSEWNEVKHKTLRMYFDELPRTKIDN